MNIMMGTVAISLCPADRQPLTADAIVEEQDTCLLLGTDPVIRDTRESYPSLVKKMGRQKPLLPGQILVKHTRPLRFISILYDIEQTPVCTEETVAMVLNDLLDRFHEYKLQSVAIPLLGCAHGKIRVSGFVKLLQETLLRRGPVYPAEIILIVSPDEIDDVGDIIRNFLAHSKPV